MPARKGPRHPIVEATVTAWRSRAQDHLLTADLHGAFYDQLHKVISAADRLFLNAFNLV